MARLSSIFPLDINHCTDRSDHIPVNFIDQQIIRNTEGVFLEKSHLPWRIQSFKGDILAEMCENPSQQSFMFTAVLPNIKNRKIKSEEPDFHEKCLDKINAKSLVAIPQQRMHFFYSSVQFINTLIRVFTTMDAVKQPVFHFDDAFVNPLECEATA